MCIRDSTRPDTEVLAGEECWERTVRTDGNTWTIEDLESLTGLQINGQELGIGTFLPEGVDDRIYIADLQEALLAAGLDFASVSFDNRTLTIAGLDNSVTSISVQDPANGLNQFGATTFAPYTGDTVLFYTVYRLSLIHISEPTRPY